LRDDVGGDADVAGGLGTDLGVRLETLAGLSASVERS
jgi:hypothetical protein